LQSRDRYRMSVGETPGIIESQRELPGRSLDKNIFQQPSDIPEIMGSFYEAGWEIPRNWLKVNVCYSLGPSVQFSVSQLLWGRFQSSCGCPFFNLTIRITGLSHQHLAHFMRVNNA
jgi:hypothetical protein